MTDAPPRRATIVDVAARAGVSIKTVSRIFNDEPHVRAVLRDRVRQAAADLSYHPNVVAQGLVGRRSYLLGLVYENPSPNYIVELQKGMLDRLRGERYRLMVLPTGSIAALAGKMTALLRAAALDGVVLTPPASDHPGILEELRAAGLPFARIAPTRFPDVGPSTTTDDIGAARDLTDYLIGLGHRTIGMIKGDPTHAATEARLLGFSQALGKAGIEHRHDLIEQGLFTFDSGLAAGHALLDRSDRPTAIFAQNDDMAAGALMAARDLGLDVPGDVSIAGYDNSEISRAIWPRITTIHQPVFDMARSATDALIAKLGDQPFAAVVSHVSTLIVRQSTGPPGR